MAVLPQYKVKFKHGPWAGKTHSMQTAPGRIVVVHGNVTPGKYVRTELDEDAKAAVMTWHQATR